MEKYDINFYENQKDGSYNSAKIIIPLVRQFVKPKTVMDLGCGLGTWLAVWKEYGVDVIGVDGDYVERDMLYIDEKEFISADLSKEYVNVDKKVDLVESLEVAEHLPEDRAYAFIRNLTDISDVVLFSAAIPYQGGTNHINEQWQSYWAEIFASRGYVPLDCIRTQQAKLAGVQLPYAQNIIIYIKETELYRYPLLQEFYLKHHEYQVLDYVHPQGFLLAMKRA